jgi:multiple sugar transport system substrate-binding protein
MSPVLQYDGLTWNHPRGFEALDAAAREQAVQDAGLQIRWHKQPLEGFESHPVGDLAARYDLVVLDHPCLGEVVAQECFLPLNDLFDEEERRVWCSTSVGPSYSSYQYAGNLWALPLDAATQTCAINPQAIGPGMHPATWTEVIDLAGHHPMCLSLAGPHALLSFFSICAQIAGEESRSGQDEFFEDEVCWQAYEMLSTLYEKSIKTHLNDNPIGILDCMASSREIALCPLIYGYVNYAVQRQGHGTEQLAFIDAPRCTEQSPARSTVGGTGLAISRKARVTEALLAHVRYLMSPAYQVDFAPAHGGQPSSEIAWCNPEVNARANGFYRNTLETMSNGWIRPRYAGYVEFQGRASAFLRDALAAGRSAQSVIGKLKAMFAESRKSPTTHRENAHV